MANLFKTRFVPNADGTNSATAITNANTAFVHTYVGDDLTGDGTREYPFKSAFKANQKSGVTYIVFRGVINEAFSTGKCIIGDDINQALLTINYSASVSEVRNLTYDRFNTISWYVPVIRCIQLDDSINSSTLHERCFFKKNFKQETGWGSDRKVNYCTISSLLPFGNYQNYFVYNSLIISSFDTTDRPSIVRSCVFSSACIFKYNNVAFLTPLFTNDSTVNIQLLKIAYLAAGMSQSVADALFFKDSFNNETCKIIWEQKDGGLHPNIFNRYNEDGSIADYSLNPNLYNEALYAGDTGSFVGCFKPANAVVSADWDAPIDVNTDGTDTVNAGTLLRVNVDDTIDFNTLSGQIWNRLKCNQTIVIPNGIEFDGTPISSNDGTAFGYYFGKHQDLMNPTALTPADALEPNCIYKVCNPLRSIYQAAIFNGNQYLPDYFFKTGVAPLVFTLLNADSGTVLKKVLATPLESVEVIPYDDIATPSATFPRFSSPMFGSCYMLYHKIGARIDQPVLFSEVANDKIAYYDAWAVTNADQEFATLVLDTVNYYYKVPILKYLRTELNGHFNADYDQ